MPAFLSPIRLPSFRCRRAQSRRCPIRAVAAAPLLIVGLNEYSHDTSVAIIDAHTGRLLHALAKERITRRKHDAGDAASVVESAFQALSAAFDTPAEALAKNVTLVVANNHHFRIAPYEARLPLQIALRYAPPSSLSPWNLIGSQHASHKLAPKARKIELSHHLAHAFSAIVAAPFEQGLVVVMDGMGDSLDDWQTAKDDDAHFSDWDVCNDADTFVEWPADVQSRPGVSFREAESAYVFDKKDGTKLTRVFKRWTPENAPSELPNHSFEEMESVGAMYSRVSSLCFLDWNACGKVMGLAPYGRKLAGDKPAKQQYFMKGHLYDGTLDVSDGQKKGLEHIGKSMHDAYNDKESRQYFESLAFHIQQDLEDVVLNFMRTLQQKTGQKNLVFTGGVALNSTLNGAISTSKIFDNMFVPPYPGDEGVSVGCAAFGSMFLGTKTASKMTPLVQPIFSMPYFGKEYTESEIIDAVRKFEPWITWERTDEAEATASALNRSEVVAWFRGRSEFGPRALGNRSILADPRPRGMVDHVNKVVKKRESFRPFAPSVLAEHAHEWFKDCNENSSPFMSMTLPSLRSSEVQAVVHIDGTSRLQTLRREHNPKYHEMITLFYKLSGVPMVLNTSFNVAGEPIVDSPEDALRTFLDTEGIDMLTFPGMCIRKSISVKTFSDTDVVSCSCPGFRSHQVQDGYGSNLRTQVTFTLQDTLELAEGVSERTVELMDDLALAVLEVIHSHGDCTVSTVYGSLVETMEPSFAEDEVFEEPHVQPKDIHERLVDLYRKRLIHGPSSAPVEKLQELRVTF